MSGVGIVSLKLPRPRFSNTIDTKPAVTDSRSLVITFVASDSSITLLVLAAVNALCLCPASRLCYSVECSTGNCSFRCNFEARLTKPFFADTLLWSYTGALHLNSVIVWPKHPIATWVSAPRLALGFKQLSLCLLFKTSFVISHADMS